MKSERGVTLITIVVMIVVITIIAGVSIVGGLDVMKEAKKQAKEDNLATVKAAVNKEAVKAGTAGVLTPANAKFYGIKNAKLAGIKYNDDGTDERIEENIGEDWYLLDEAALKEMGVEYADDEYVVNYKLNVVIPLSSVENIHEKIAFYNAQ